MPSPSGCSAISQDLQSQPLRHALKEPDQVLRDQLKDWGRQLDEGVGVRMGRELEEGGGEEDWEEEWVGQMGRKLGEEE